MKALQLVKKDQPWKICEVKSSVLKKGMVLVKLKAAAFNHRDIWISKGMYAGIKYPIIPGSDGCGVITDVGRELSRDILRKDVIINPSFGWGESEEFQGKDFEILGLPNNGTMAEYVIVPHKYIHDQPMHLTPEQAAALPLAGLTAYRALFSRANLKPGDRVLINGIGGGVALFALQFALGYGCEVWVTSSSPKKIKAAKALGAVGGANYKTERWDKAFVEKAGTFDVIIDGAGGAGFEALINVASPGARIAIYGGTAGKIASLSPQKLFWKQISIFGTTMGSDRDFYNMLHFVNKHEIVPVVDEVFPFDEAVKAAEKLEQGKQFGKVVVRMS